GGSINDGRQSGETARLSDRGHRQPQLATAPAF
ncbi:hypothetical protein O988_09540, partial [Pseudogymnoascus sp. VKM F-3808]